MAASNMIRYRMAAEAAAEAAAEILSQKLQMLLSHPVRIRCLLMEPLAKEAKKKLATIQQLFTTQDGLSQSTEWLGRLLQAMYDAEEFIEKFHLREAHGRHEALHVATRPAAALVSKYKLWRDLSNLVNKLQELCQDQHLKGKEAEGNTEKVPAGSSSPASVPGQGEKLTRLTSLWNRASTNFLWREEEKKMIMKRIGTGAWELGVTVILGEQGTGKTFLARWVYKEVMVLGFEWRAWVRLSGSKDMQEISFETLNKTEKLAMEEKYMSSDEITEMLCNESTMRKFLIVLDDLHSSNEHFLQTLVRSLFYGRGHIIITTRDDCIAKKMSRYNAGLIELGKLDLKKSQEILTSKLHGVPDGQSLSIEKGILETSQGLPLRISLLSGLLPNAGEQELTVLAQHLAKDDSKMSLLDILHLSYHRLPVQLKSCLIYMALFPLASPIPTRRLVRLWLAEGLLDLHCYNMEGKRTRQPEDVGETFILELAERNMIDVVSWRADGFPKACHMLTSLYDMIRPIAMGMGFLHIHATSKSKDKNDGYPTGQEQQLMAQLLERPKVRWLAGHMNIVTDSCDGSIPDFYLSHIRSFLSFDIRRGIVTRTFLRNMTSKTAYSLLRVLDLEGVFKPSLQGVLHKLVLLRYLGLRCTVLDSLPSTVADLHYLETLDIKHTNITSLPSSFWKARNLRHLHLNWFSIDFKTILKACSNDVMALTNLQTLSGLVIGEVEEDLMTGLVNGLAKLTTLKLFLQHSGRDSSGAAGERVGNWISSGLTNLQSLTLGVVKKANFATSTGPIPELRLAEQHDDLLELYLLGQLNKPNWTLLLPGSLRVLTLSGSKVEADMMPQLGGLLINLRTLRLLANSFLGSCLRFAKDGFPSLVILKIWKLPRLEEVFIEQGAMPHLKELEFRYLDWIKNVEGINECEELENVCVVVKKGATNFVDLLKEKIEEGKCVYKIEDTKTPEFMDNNSRDEDEDEDASP